MTFDELELMNRPKLPHKLVSLGQVPASDGTTVEVCFWADTGRVLALNAYRANLAREAGLFNESLEVAA
jgi:hypothetical protein